MKKALIALSVAAGMIGAAQADNTTTLYGSLGFGTQFSHNNGQKVSGTSSVGGTIKNSRWNLEEQTAKIGVKGTEDLGNGLQAFFKFEFGVDDGLRTRYAYLGLTGDFGTVTLGKQDSLYKVVTNFNDIFEDSFYNDNLAAFSDATGGGRIPKVISYVSPNFSGFQFGLAGVLDGSNQIVGYSDKKSFDAAQAGVWYKGNGFYAGLAYSWMDAAKSLGSFDPSKGELNSKTDKGITRVIGGAFGYENDTFKAGLGVQHINSRDYATGVKHAGQLYNVAGEYYLGQNTFRAGVAAADYRNMKNIYTYALGYQYNFSKRTYTWVEGQYVDGSKTDFGNSNNGYQVKVGLRHNF